MCVVADADGLVTVGRWKHERESVEVVAVADAGATTAKVKVVVVVRIWEWATRGNDEQIACEWRESGGFA